MIWLLDCQHVCLHAQNFLLEQLATCRGLGMSVPAAAPPDLIVYGGRNDFPGDVIKKAYVAAEGHFKKKPSLIFVCLLDRGMRRSGTALLTHTLLLGAKQIICMASFGLCYSSSAATPRLLRKPVFKYLTQ